MFDHEHHCKILRVLDALDPSIFEKTGSYFGGGTLIALLHNADRWADSAIESRDLIDLAVLRLHEGLCEEAISKAEEAYPVVEPLAKALQKFQSSQAYRSKCFDALQIQNRSVIIDGIDLLATDQGMGRTERSRDEL